MLILTPHPVCVCACAQSPEEGTEHLPLSLPSPLRQYLSLKVGNSWGPPFSTPFGMGIIGMHRTYYMDASMSPSSHIFSESSHLSCSPSFFNQLHFYAIVHAILNVSSEIFSSGSFASSFLKITHNVKLWLNRVVMVFSCLFYYRNVSDTYDMEERGHTFKVVPEREGKSLSQICKYIKKQDYNSN